MLKFKIIPVKDAAPPKLRHYLVRFSGYTVNTLNSALYRDRYFPTRKAAVEHANRRVLDYMGIF